MRSSGTNLPLKYRIGTLFDKASRNAAAPVSNCSEGERSDTPTGIGEPVQKPRKCDTPTWAKAVSISEANSVASESPEGYRINTSMPDEALGFNPAMI